MPVSMYGLDLSFLKTPENQDRLRWMKNRLIESKREVPIASKHSDLAAPMVMGDIKPFVSPVTKEVISSRSSLARHNRANGVRQCGEVDPKAWTDHITKEHQKRLAEPTPGVNFEWSKFGE